MTVSMTGSYCAYDELWQNVTCHCGVDTYAERQMDSPSGEYEYYGDGATNEKILTDGATNEKILTGGAIGMCVCPPGQYLYIGGSNAYTPLNSANGTEKWQSGHSVFCVLCDIGTWQDKSGQLKCNYCDSYYTQSTGSTSRILNLES